MTSIEAKSINKIFSDHNVFASQSPDIDSSISYNRNTLFQKNFLSAAIESGSNRNNIDEQTATTSLKRYLIITGAVLSYGAMLYPGFALGAACGFINLILKIPLSMLVRSAPQEEECKKSTYVKSIVKNPLSGAITIPIIEEAIFRGGLQTILDIALKYFIPVSAEILVPMLSISLATTLAITITAVAFGLAHWSNNHSGAGTQAMLATWSGLVLGVLCAKYGIFASIGSHIMNNTVAIGLLLASPQIDEKTESNITKNIDEVPLEADCCINP